MRLIDADALTEFLKCLLPERGMWEIEGDTGKNAVCETVAEAVEMVKNMETIQPEKAQFSLEDTTKGTTSDLIDRQQAIDALDCINGVEEVLRSLPSVQPEAHEGTWVYGEDSTADCVDGYRCSQCGFFVPWDYNHKLIDYINDYAYCPHCGAKMINK